MATGEGCRRESATYSMLPSQKFLFLPSLNYPLAKVTLRTPSKLQKLRIFTTIRVPYIYIESTLNHDQYFRITYDPVSQDVRNELKLIPFCVSDRGAGWCIHRRSCSHSRSPQHLFCSGYQRTCKPNGTMVHSLLGNGGLPCCHHVGAGASRNSGCRHGHCLHCGCGGGCRGIWSSWCCGVGIYWSNCCGKPCSRGSRSSNCRYAYLHEDFRFYFMKLCNTSSCQPTLKHVLEQMQNVFCWYLHSLCFDYLTHMGIIEVTNAQPKWRFTCVRNIEAMVSCGSIIFSCAFCKILYLFWHM